MAVLAVAVASLLILGVWVATRSVRTALLTALAVGAAMATQYVIASTGILRAWHLRPPPMMLLVGVMLAATIALARSRLGGALAERTSFALLVGAQAFRFPLELDMHHAASEGVMPMQMSYSGSNFDILTGISALALGVLLAAGKVSAAAIRVWNIAGFCLLLNIVVIAVASLPMFHAFGENRVNVWVTYPPFVWLPGVLVPAALLGHLLVWRKLVKAQPSSTSPPPAP